MVSGASNQRRNTMAEQRTAIAEEKKVRNIRSLALMEAAEFFRDSDGVVAKVLDEFAYRASQGLDIVPEEE
jgi:hypothetical protein